MTLSDKKIGVKEDNYLKDLEELRFVNSTKTQILRVEDVREAVKRVKERISNLNIADGYGFTNCMKIINEEMGEELTK